MHLHNVNIRACFVLFITSAALCFGQAGRGGISGLVTDRTGGLIPGATIEATHTSTGVALETRSTSAGLYSFTNLVPGTYRVRASQPGFQTVVRESIPVEVDNIIEVNLEMPTGDLQQSITVSAEPVLTNATNSTIGQLVTNRALENLPLNGRNVLYLVQLVPGVVPINGAVNETGAVNRPGVEVSAMNINGGQAGSVTYFADGAPLTVEGYGAGASSPAYGPAQEGVQEFRLVSSNVAPSYSSPGTGVITLVTKSGTDSFHGSAFYFARPNAMAANDPFVKASQAQAGSPNRPPDFSRYQAGGSIGGPIVRQKLFFFGDYEWTQTRRLSTLTTTQASDAEREGDFSGVPTIYNPFDIDAAGRRVPFPGNQIPRSLMDPVALNMLEYMPRANQAGRGIYHQDNYFASASFPEDSEKYNGRLDYYIGPRHQMFGRVTWVDFVTGSADHYGNGADPAFYTGRTHAAGAVIGYNFTLSPNTLFQVRQSFARHAELLIAAEKDAANFDIVAAGFPASLQSQQVIRSMPRMHIAGMNGFGSRVPTIGFQFISYNHNTSVAVEKHAGRHNLKAGFEYRKNFINMGQPVAPSGQYHFDGTATASTTLAGDGYGFASYLLGMGSINTSVSSFTIDPYVAQASPYYGLYVHDNIRATRNLTVDLGLRMEIFGGRTERYDRMTWFDPDAVHTVNGVEMRGGLRFAQGGKSPFAIQWKNFGPRVGLAYRLGERTVLHGGFGMFFGPTAYGVGTAGDNADSFSSRTRWAATEYDQFGNSILLHPLSNPFPNGVLLPSQGALGLATNLGSSLTTMFRDQPVPKAYNWNIGVQREIGAGFLLSAAWVGSRGLHQIGDVDLNNLSYDQLAQHGASLNQQVPNPFLDAIADPTASLYGRATVPRWQTLVDYPQFATGSAPAGVTVRSMGVENSIYHSFQFKAEKRLSAHFSTLVSFTGGKVIGTGNGRYGYIGQHGGQQNWKNRYLERAVDPQDVSRWLSWAVNYDLPVGTGRALAPSHAVVKALLANWRVNSIFAWGTGVPIIVSGGNWPNRSTFFSQRPNLVCDPADNKPGRAEQWISPACFAAPTSPFVPGNAPRTLRARNDGAFNLDLSLAKTFPFTESTALQLRVEAFNLTNSVHLGRVNAGYNSRDTSTFGRITSAYSTPRQFQLAARFTF